MTDNDRVTPICVLGLGLIGGSVLRAATAAGRRCWAATASPVDAEAATSEGVDVRSPESALRRAADEDALVVVAVPLTSVPEVLRLVDQHAGRCLLTDVVSVKEPVLRAVETHAPGARYVGGHPMAGTASSGWHAGDARLFAGAAWVVTTDEADPAVWAEVAGLALDCGAEVVPAPAREHDAAVARVSHLPHLLAEVLSAVAEDGGPLAAALAAGSFADGTRVAGTRPALVRAMCEGNRDALLTALDDALGRLGVARGALATTGSLRAAVEDGHRAHLRRQRAGETPTAAFELPLDGPGALDALAELGRCGGRVTGLAGGVVSGRRPAPAD
ncbi:prephenate dehydrogenase [Actinoalloteichus spitiensis]|uniref:prephenate dehydrogenase n=1 Tax=Actinoalloteichus spitiensis TaxID=252394 RepID=UPI000382EB7E|nr:prephenate dehydrogenase [Actinoalloteichus spitiensis]